MTEKQKKIFTTNILHQTTFVPQFALESEENCVTETPKSRASFCRRKHQPCWILISSLPAFPRRSLRCVHGREHHGPGGDRGGDDAHPAPARGSGAQRVRAALHVSCRTCLCAFSCDNTRHRVGQNATTTPTATLELVMACSVVPRSYFPGMAEMLREDDDPRPDASPRSTHLASHQDQP